MTEATKPKILLVEDDKYISAVFLKRFANAGFDAEHAADGDEALKKAREKKPDLILLDIIMPLKNGFLVLKELKADPLLKDVKVIVLSNLSQEEDRAKAMSLGASDYIVKANIPFRDLVVRVKQSLGLL